LIETTINEVWDEDSESWKKTNKRIINYNSKQLKETEIELEWSEDNSEWVNAKKHVFTFLNDKYETDHSSYIWNIDSSNWVIDYQIVYNFDDNFNIIDKIYFITDFYGELARRSKTVYFWSELEVLGIDEKFVSTIDIFPNPAKESITLKNVDFNEIVRINIYSTTGQLIKVFNGIKKENIDVQFLKNGFYNIEIFTKSNRRVKKFIKI